MDVPMTDAFLSYSRTDEAFAVDLVKELQARRWNVWRDQDSLRAGDRWPKLLGEAIAARVFFVLLWSAAAGGSNFVELEWTIAVSMRRRIGILALDKTPLPATLSPYEARQPSSPRKAAKWLDGATGFGRAPEYYAEQSHETLRDLEAAPETAQAVLSARLDLDLAILGATCNVGCSGGGSGSHKIRFLS
jgi:hypothetical protein